ncbi:hypothetical protein D3C80_2149140 [compost metagenome]
MPITVSANAGAAWACQTSRTIARASTSAAQAPKPCSKRAAMKVSMLLANSIPVVANR